MKSGMDWSIPDFIMDWRLGHLGRMKDERMPKQLLFGELQKKRACHGTKKRWRDQVAGDLQAIGLKYGWYQLCQNREAWFVSCHDGVNVVASCRKHNTCAANRQLQDSHLDCKCGQTF